MYFSTATTSFLASLATASPLTPRSTSTSFKLVYRGVPGNKLPIPLKALAHGTWSITSSTTTPSTLVLEPDTPGKSLIFYQYETSGSTAVATSNTGLVITPGGTSTVPSLNVLEIKEGDGTPGVSVGTTPLLGYEEGRFQACNVEKEGGSGDKEIVVRYVAKGQRLLEGCMEMELVVRCMGEGSGGKLGELVGVECYMTPF